MQWRHILSRMYIWDYLGQVSKLKGKKEGNLFDQRVIIMGDCQIARHVFIKDIWNKWA
jgi:hypothetical protein